MRIPVVIESLPNHRFRAVGPLVGLSAEGDTTDQARQRLEDLVRDRVAAGLKLAWIETDAGDASSHPLARHAGIWRDDPMFDEYMQAVEEFRSTCEREDTIAAVREGMEDIKAGRTRPAREALHALASVHGISLGKD